MKPLFRSELEEILNTSRDDLLSLQGARIFITGGTGFFGKWIVETLVHARRQLLGGKLDLAVLTRDPARARSVFQGAFEFSEVEWITGDLVSSPLPPGKFTHLIHAATPARASINESDPLQMLDVTIEGTRRVLDFARLAGVSRLLLTSSGAVYGAQHTELAALSEDHQGFVDPMDPRNAYAFGKLISEHLCRQFATTSREILIARCFAFVGPGLPLDEHFAIGNFIGDALAGRKILIRGDGTAYRSYLYPTDLMAQLLAVLARGQSCRPYNVGHSRPSSIREVAEAVASATGGEIEMLGLPQTGARAARYVPEMSRLHSELGAQPRVELAEAIRRTIQWHQHSGPAGHGK
jgi:nucleoside-diphosphate-sugar epimerase